MFARWHAAWCVWFMIPNHLLTFCLCILCVFFVSSIILPISWSLEGAPISSSYGTPQNFPKFEHPSHELLKDNNFTQHAYHKYHSKCLKGKTFNWPCVTQMYWWSWLLMTLNSYLYSKIKIYDDDKDDNIPINLTCSHISRCWAFSRHWRLMPFSTAHAQQVPISHFNVLNLS